MALLLNFSPLAIAEPAAKLCNLCDPAIPRKEVHMDAPFDARPNRVPWPPIFYAATLAVAFMLESFIPLPALKVAGLWRVPDVVVATIGFLFLRAGFVGFRAARTPVSPTARAETLVRGGIYKYTRNPMYLGFCIIYFGLGIALARPWLLILTPIMAAGLQELAIKREEKHLKSRFGDTWHAYTTEVPRWL